ncbi:DegT/DnrJ/EryC1/StrS family aminotransferase [Nocardioides sp. STR3]|uniref:DegT/DnrJ/EryC1/StrS family aminotransferase n=2 Tax=Nocardioides pinisoli TaxID=2950279 RepID=A0ABT1KSD5_9ACTN|nr:DegT/DnrJ/EryC1/StrS family aminotransferase [Nocardioides pinisoli]
MHGAARIPFALPDIGEDEISAVTEAMRSGWLTSGPRMKEFESAFAEFIGSGVETVSVNSATAGLHLAMEALDIGPGDEVLVPTWTFTATAEVVRYLGATPVLVDVEPDTLNLDLAAAAALVTDRTRAVMPVHFAGLPVAPGPLRDFASRHGLNVVEDAAHALPAARDGELVGSGDSAATVFSFYATKTITTGEGGMIVTRDPDLAHRARVMRLHGISRDAFDRYRSELPAWRYDVIAPGFKYNLTDPAAAMGLVQLGRAESMRSAREDISRRYDEALQGLPLTLPPHGPSGTRHAWHLYVVRLHEDAPHGRDTLIERLAALGVGTSVHFIPLHLQPYWRDLTGARPIDFPVASDTFERCLSLPLYSSMSTSDVDRVIDMVTQELT